MSPIQERTALRLVWCLVLVAAIGPIWTVPRDIWDGVIGAYGLERGLYAGIHDWLVPGNWGLMYLMFRGMGWLSELLPVAPWVWVKLLLTASLIGISFETRQLCTGLLRWDERSSQTAAVLALAFPCWYLLYGSTFVYLVFIWWVFLGHRWLHEGKGLRLAAGYLLMLASFQVNSNFVMVFALEAARWSCRDQDTRWHWGRSIAVTGSAVLVYLVLRLAFPPGGLYAGYNNLVLPTSAAALISWVRAALMFATWLPLIVLPGVVGWWLMRGQRVAGTDAPLHSAVAVSLLFAGALFAYMAVGKGAPLFVVNLPFEWLGAGKHLGRDAGSWFFTTVDGWSTRHTFLFSVPAAIACVALLRFALGRPVAGATSRAWWGAFAVALVFNLAWMAHGHDAKLHRLAQEESIVRALQSRAAPPPGRLDLALVPRPAWSVWTYEANYWMWLAYQRAAWAVASVPLQDSRKDATWRDREEAVAGNSAGRDYYLMSEMQPGACTTRWRLELPAGLNGGSLWLDQLRVKPLEAAKVIPLAEDCAS